jgi:hypothetical protein
MMLRILFLKSSRNVFTAMFHIIQSIKRREKSTTHYAPRITHGMRYFEACWGDFHSMTTSPRRIEPVLQATKSLESPEKIVPGAWMLWREESSEQVSILQRLP